MAHSELTSAFISHYRTLLSFVRRKVPARDVAEDIVQDAFLRINAIDQDVAVLKPLALFYRVTGNLTTDYLREHATRRRYFDSGEMPDDISDDKPSPEGCLESDDRMRQMLTIIDQLPPRSKEVFHLRKVENLSSQEIAAQLGISQNMVQKHLRYALLHCQERMRASEK